MRCALGVLFGSTSSGLLVVLEYCFELEANALNLDLKLISFRVLIYVNFNRCKQNPFINKMQQRRLWCNLLFASVIRVIAPQLKIFLFYSELFKNNKLLKAPFHSII